mmetsp:Transcript_31073/g.73234  ORF Transcript_31073/g.73234 Transcript_31073/m.73234 type:complete len:230 (-) Transcript_31073:119-808(-)
MEDTFNAIFCCSGHSDGDEPECVSHVQRRRPRGRSRTPKGNVNAWLGCSSRNNDEEKTLEISIVDSNHRIIGKKHRKGRRRRAPEKRSKSSRSTALNCRNSESETMAETDVTKHSRNIFSRKKGRRRRQEYPAAKTITTDKDNKRVIGCARTRYSARDCSLSTKSVDSTLDSSIDTREYNFEIIMEPCDSLADEKTDKSRPLRLLRNLSFISQKVQGSKTRVRNLLKKQ